MRGFTGCGFGPFACHHHDQNIGPYGNYGPFERFSSRRLGQRSGPLGQNFGPPEPCCRLGHHGPRFGHRRHFFGLGPDFGAESENCCQDCCGYGGHGYGRDPCPRVEERGPQGPGCSDSEHPRCRPDDREGRGPRCVRPHDRSRERSPRRHRGNEPYGEDRPQRRDGPCNGPLQCEEGRNRGHRGRCHRSPSCYDSRLCGRRGHEDESKLFDLYGARLSRPHFGPHFVDNYSPNHRPIATWVKLGPFYRSQRNNSDNESGNETERRGRKTCCKKNKDQNRDGTVFVQRIVVEKEPRCNSV